MAGEIPIFLLLTNNYEQWIANYERRTSERKRNGKWHHFLVKKFSGLIQENGRTYCGWKYSNKICFNDYDDIIEYFINNNINNNDKKEAEAYNKALKKACKESKVAKAAINP